MSKSKLIFYGTSNVADLYCKFAYFVATYQRFDGIILPEHKTKIQKFHSSGGWFGSAKEDPSMCNGVKLSSFDYYTKDLKTANHKELRKSSLVMHLQNVHDVLVGKESMSDSVFCIEVVCTTYLSLHKYHLCYKRGYGYSSGHDWEFHETTKVYFTNINQDS